MKNVRIQNVTVRRLPQTSIAVSVAVDLQARANANVDTPIVVSWLIKK